MTGDIEIIYEDRELIAINKPAGIAVHAGDSVSGRTVADEVATRFPEIKGVGENPLRPGMVHRLDRDTSGVMVIARTDESFRILKSLFKTRDVEKTYWAIACGVMKEKQGTIAFPIGRLAAMPLKRGVADGRRDVRGAREAFTAFRVLKEGGGYSLLELTPKTGRMHQLRVHLKAVGHPVACDVKYGGKKVCCPPGAGRQLLHARSLAFSFPGGRRFFFEADPPEDFDIALRSLS